MKSSEEIYRGVILDHARHPRNRGILENPDLQASAYNPLCGDELIVTLRLRDEMIEECKAQVRGCSICQASASMMCEQVLGSPLSGAVSFAKTFRSCFDPDQTGLPVEIEPMRPLVMLKTHRSRIKCVLLPWDAFEECAQIHTNPN